MIFIVLQQILIENTMKKNYFDIFDVMGNKLQIAIYNYRVIKALLTSCDIFHAIVFNLARYTC